MLAEKVGLQKETISRIENGKQNVSIDNIIAIAEALELPMEELCLENPAAIPMKFVVSDENVKTLKKIFERLGSVLERTDIKKAN